MKSSPIEPVSEPMQPLDASFRQKAIVGTLMLIGIGAFFGVMLGLAATEETSFESNLQGELSFWPVAILLCLLIAIPGYKMAGIKGLIIAPVALALVWILGTLIVGMAFPAFMHLIYSTINWIAGESSKLRHAIVGGLIGVTLAVFGALLNLRSQWKDYKKERQRRSDLSHT